MDGYFEGSAILFSSFSPDHCRVPIKGSCSVWNQKVTLRFPATGAEFDLPRLLCKEMGRHEFEISHHQGQVMVMLEYIPELDAYHGIGHIGRTTVWDFTLYHPDNPLAKLECL
ncbi:hypothetical protein CAPTEDRAFT_193442 [Capitella teleta]|uniref:C2 domain-containing protein n=1 Tax=Capitella teleta TaxID=283909 RepID=R7TU98_CAPTE|nr:hypothetical protein CAPTEDRAFT_193442 [Capitella teleta]|eukprot:ELT97483.1 hypothetical protein CAPTEDRAFT_193442 [Capitella teleta]